MTEPRPVPTKSPQINTLADARLVILWIVDVVERLIAAVKELDGGTP